MLMMIDRKRQRGESEECGGQNINCCKHALWHNFGYPNGWLRRASMQCWTITTTKENLYEIGVDPFGLGDRSVVGLAKNKIYRGCSFVVCNIRNSLKKIPIFGPTHFIIISSTVTHSSAAATYWIRLVIAWTWGRLRLFDIFGGNQDDVDDDGRKDRSRKNQ